MAKQITGYLKLHVPAGKAAPAPPIGPALGQRGLNIMEFCKAFNAQTQDLEPEMPIPTTITIYQDKSFTFKTTPSISNGNSDLFFSQCSINSNISSSDVLCL